MRVAAAAVFIPFGVGKFSSHTSELASFRGYGLPAPGTFEAAGGLTDDRGLKNAGPSRDPRTRPTPGLSPSAGSGGGAP
jgi:hypothetical protein